MDKKFFTIKELAEHMKCSVRYLHEEKKRGNLRCSKIGRKLIFEAQDVERWLKKKVQVPA